MNNKNCNRLEIDLIKLMEGCFLFSIVHAIMVSKYPMLSFEHSWDNFNYNIQDISGKRETITFYNNYCVAAFRNEESYRMKDVINNCEYLEKYFYNCEVDIFKLAKNETLQYLLDDTNYGIYPCITSTFWGKFDDNKVYSNDVINDIFFNGGDLIKDHLLNYNDIISKLISKYNMNNNQIILLEKIFKNKVKEKNKLIFLSKSDIKLIDIPNYEGFKESKTSIF
nr:hypothetical protein [uncultured Tyzzerella sp.]